jgi:hypothetical protein
MTNAWADTKVAPGCWRCLEMLPATDCALIGGAGQSKTAAESGEIPGRHYDFDAVR